MRKNGAPYGERHGKTRHPDSLVKQVRDRYYDQGHSVREMADELGIPEYTLRDWVAFKTRVYGTESKTVA